MALALSIQTCSFAGAGMYAPAAPQSARFATPEMVAVGRSAPKAKAAKKDEFLYGLPGTGHLYGLPGFDPLGFATGKSKDEVFRLREAEITHSRVAMLACAGFLVQEKVHPLFSGDGGPAIDQIPALPVWVWGVMLAGIGNAEQVRIAKGGRSSTRARARRRRPSATATS